MAYVLDDDNINMNIWGCYYPTRNVLNQRGNPSIYRIPSLKQKRAVVSVPVHFIGSDSWKKSRSDYAVKIQKSFRGFRVRKIINKLLELNRAVDDVAAAAADDDDLILRDDVDDDKERLKFNEALMALLLKLDAVTAFDDPVRVCRKNVIRKACLLLETIDSIPNPAHSHLLQTPHQLDRKPAEDECSDDYSEDDDYTEDDCSHDYSQEAQDGCSDDDYDDDDDDDDDDGFGKSSGVDDNAAVDPTAQDKGEVLSDDEVADETLEKPSQVEKAVSVDMEKVEEEEEEADASDGDGKGWGADDDGEAWECVGQEDDNMEFLDIGQGVGDKQRQGGWLVVKENKDSDDHDNLMVKLLMEENHKLMKTVAQLCNKTEDQAVLITELFDRVKHLEVSVQELEDVHLFGSLSINKADKGWRSFLPTAR